MIELFVRYIPFDKNVKGRIGDNLPQLNSIDNYTERQDTDTQFIKVCGKPRFI